MGGVGWGRFGDANHTAQVGGRGGREGRSDATWTVGDEKGGGEVLEEEEKWSNEGVKKKGRVDRSSNT